MSATPASDLHSIVADVGGTNTRVALAKGPDLRRDTTRKYRNKEHDGIAAVLEAFIAEEGGVACRAACVAIAGPVRDGEGTLTNLDWSVDENLLRSCTGADCADVLNDLQAQGHALGRIAESDLRAVIRGADAPEHATQLVIGVGTGFNAAPVYHLDSERLVAPAEAGHINFPIRTEDDLRLARYLEKRRGFPDVEEVLSGRGLAQIYDWLAHEDGEDVESDSQTVMEAVDNGSDPRADRAVEVFVTILGRVAGNLALDYLPFGGIFLIGGIGRAASRHFDRFDFAGAMHDKGRFSDFTAQFPVAVIEDDYAALAGCAAHLDRTFPA